MFLRPFGWYCSACFGILFVSIFCTCCSHFYSYYFISFTMFCAPVCSRIHWFISLSSFVIPTKDLKNYVCAASKRYSSLFFSTQVSLPNFNAALPVMLWILTTVLITLNWRTVARTLKLSWAPGFYFWHTDPKLYTNCACAQEHR